MQKTDRLKCNPQLGRLPVLQFVMPAELRIDDSYQRQLDTNSSRLIRKIAQNWNWDLCQPLVVSRRAGGQMFVIDGQHRLEAARLRRDIAQLPCVIVEYADPADEAASFVTLNQQRKPLSKMELFKAAITSGDEESCAIAAMMERAGMAIAPHYTHTSWKPGMVANIGGIQAGWRRYGGRASYVAMRALVLAYEDQVLRYAGTIYPGVVAISASAAAGGEEITPDRFAAMVAMIGKRTQTEWRQLINQARADDSNLNFPRASAQVLQEAWEGVDQPSGPVINTPAPKTPSGVALVRSNGSSVDRFEARAAGKTVFCEQCDQLVHHGEAANCRSAFCKVRRRA